MIFVHEHILQQHMNLYFKIFDKKQRNGTIFIIKTIINDINNKEINYAYRVR